MTLPLAQPQEQPTVTTKRTLWLGAACTSEAHDFGFFTYEQTDLPKAFCYIRAVFEGGAVLQGCPVVMAGLGVRVLRDEPPLLLPPYYGSLVGVGGHGLWLDEAVAERVLTERRRMVA